MSKAKKNPGYAAFLTTLFAGIAVHLFALTNVFHNYDDIASYPIGMGTGASSGRWFLEIINFLSIRTGGGYNLTYLNGLVFILMVAAASYFLAASLRMKSTALACLAGISFVVFPTAVSTLLFRFTSHIYGLAVLFSVLAVYVVGRFRFSFLLSALLMALSLAIYQGFFPISVSLFVLMLMRRILEDDEHCGKKHFLTGFYYCAIIALGLIIYIVSLALYLELFGSELSGYKGIGDTSSYTLSNLPKLLYGALRSFLLLPFRDYCDIANISSIRKSYLLLELLSLALGLLCCFQKKQSPGKLAALLCCCAAFPFAVNLIVLMAPESEPYTLVVYSFVSLLWLPLMLVDILRDKRHWSMQALKLAATALVCFIALSYSYYDNVNYSTAYFASRQTENYMNSLVVQTRMTDGFSPDKPWALTGKLNDPLLEHRWEMSSRYGGNVTSGYMLTCYSAQDWIRLYYGYRIPLAEDSAVEVIKDTEEYAVMPCWPAAGSIKAIDGVMVIKLSD